jgi:Na+-driven multidrug efflux pump
MVGKLLGANNLADIRKLVSIATKFVLGFQMLIAIITLFASLFLAQLMTSETEVESILNYHLMIVPFSLGPLGICMLMVSISNALGRSYTALTISALRLFAFFLPCLWLGAQLGGIEGLFWGAFAGNILAGLCAWAMFNKTLGQIEQRAATQ